MSDNNIIDDIGGLFACAFLLFAGACVVGGIIRAINNYEPDPPPVLKEIVTTERVGNMIVERRYLPVGR